MLKPKIFGLEQHLVPLPNVVLNLSKYFFRGIPRFIASYE